MLARFAFLALLTFSSAAQSDSHGLIAIIIDDLGHSFQKGQAFIELPAPLTFAILPHTAHSQSLAVSAHEASKEVIVHLPMANLKNTPIGPGGLTASQPRTEFLMALESAINDVPHAKGINNHTGSYLTQQSEQMSWLMTEMKKRQFFFIDSRTTPNSIAEQTAKRFNVQTSRRDVFLDNERSFASIDAAFTRLIKKAQHQGAAIAIGHPYPETYEYLEQMIPELDKKGISIVPASELIAFQHQRATTPEEHMPEEHMQGDSLPVTEQAASAQR